MVVMFYFRLRGMSIDNWIYKSHLKTRRAYLILSFDVTNFMVGPSGLVLHLMI